MDHVGLKGHAEAVLEYVCTVYGHSIAHVTSSNRSNFLKYFAYMQILV